jgi:hypothetical protein
VTDNELSELRKSKATYAFTMTDGTRYYGVIKKTPEPGVWRILRGNLLPVDTTAADIASVKEH